MQMQRISHEHAIRDHADYQPENIRVLPQLLKLTANLVRPSGTSYYRQLARKGLRGSA